MREKLEQIVTSGVSRYFYVGLACILIGLALLFSAIKDILVSVGQLVNLGSMVLLFIGIIFLVVGAGVLLFLFLPGYQAEQGERAMRTHSYIGTVIYDASQPDAPKTNIEAVLPELMSSAGISGGNMSFMQTLSTEESVALDALLSTTSSNPYGSILHPENPKPINYGRTTDREDEISGDLDSNVSTDFEEGASMDAVVDESVKQSLSLKELTALQAILNTTASGSYESVLHPENPKPINYGRTTDGGEE